MKSGNRKSRMLLLGVSIVLSAFLAFCVMTLPIAGDSFSLFGVLVLEFVFSILPLSDIYMKTMIRTAL